MSVRPPIFPRGTHIAEPSLENNRTLWGPVEVVGGRTEPFEAFAACESLVRAAASGPRERVLVAVVGSGGQVGHRLLAPGDVTIVGRHTRCELRVTDPVISLRHLAIAVAPDVTTETPLVRIWDLATGKPFATEDGVRTEALSSDGPCFLTLRRSAVVVIPLGSLPAELPDGTRALWDSLPERSFLSRLADGTGMHARDRREDMTERGECTIRQVQAVRTLSELECRPDLAVATLRLAAADFAATRDLSEDDLARGVLVGRYDRCAEPISTDGVSRVHLLIARLGTALVAIDTASTNGSELHQGSSFSITRLTENTIISLAGWAFVGWSMRPRGAA